MNSNFNLKKLIVWSLLMYCTTHIFCQISFTDSGNTFEGVRDSSLEFLDVNNDGHQDILLAGKNGLGASAKIFQLYLNDGTGSYVLNSASPGSPFEDGDIATGEFGGASYLDFVYTGRLSSLAITDVKTVSSGPSFSSIGLSLPKLSNSSIAVADFNGDGHDDFIVCGENLSFSAATYLVYGDGAFGLAEDQANNFIDVSNGTVVAVDVDNDGDMDIFMSGTNNSFSNESKLYLNDGSGMFSESAGFNAEPLNFSSADFADIDLDGDLDFFITGLDNSFDQKAQLYENDGSGNFSLSPQSFEEAYHGEVLFIDIENDGDQDIIYTGGIVQETFVYENNGAGQFTPVTSSGLPLWGGDAMATADVNADGKKDLVISGSDINSNLFTVLYLNQSVINIPGCTNELACNYNSQATNDDGSCLLPFEAYIDADNDNFGTGDPVLVCELTEGFSLQNGDCNDSFSGVNPDSEEICGNSEDDNCNGQIDENRLAFYRDFDNDGYGRPTPVTYACSQLPGFVTNSDDCDDDNENIYPGAPEICDDLDNDCDGQIDEDLNCCEALSAMFSYTTNNSLTIVFENQSTNLNNGGFTSIFWSFGDGNFSNDEDPIHTYSEPGVYNVVLTLFNACGNDLYEQTISVFPDGGCTNPNACNFDENALIDDGTCESLGMFNSVYWGVSDKIGINVCSGDASLDVILEDWEAPHVLESVYYLAVHESESNFFFGLIPGIYTTTYYPIDVNSPLFNASDGITDLNIELDILDGYYYAFSILSFESMDQYELFIQSGEDENSVDCIRRSEILLTFLGVTSECGDPSAISFNEDAFCINNNLCEYEIEGCTDSVALNFSSEAVISDESCIYAPCPGDFNHDGIISSSDLSSFLSAFGTSCMN